MLDICFLGQIGAVGLVRGKKGSRSTMLEMYNYEQHTTPGSYAHLASEVD